MRPNMMRNSMALWCALLCSVPCLATAFDSLTASFHPSLLQESVNEVLNDTSFTQFDSIARQSRTFEKRNRGCPSLRNALPNGWVKLRSSNRIARFSCNTGYDLIGNRYATCIRGHWNRDLPVCVSSSCPNKFAAERPLLVKSLYHGSVLDLSCELGYDLRVNASTSESYDQTPKTFSSYLTSSMRVYCVGTDWIIDDWSKLSQFGVVRRTPIHSLPTCEVFEKPVNESMKCDFENSICGWFQDNEDDFDWMRNRHTTPSHLDGTGPSYDHTLGQNQSGYYLYLESSYPRVPNDIARLYSPVYQHINNMSVACFQFYYHMFGKAIGSLKIYVKEKAQVLSELSPSWELVGDQGNNWLTGQVEIKPISTGVLRPFQIIVEGVLGYGHQGDIAIDDLSLTLGKSCYNITGDEAEVTVNEVTETPDGVIEETVMPEPELYNSTDLPRPQGLIANNSEVPSFNLTKTVTTTPRESRFNRTSQLANNAHFRNAFHEIFRTIFKMKTFPNNFSQSTLNEANSNAVAWHLGNNNVKTVAPPVPLTPTTSSTRRPSIGGWLNTTNYHQWVKSQQLTNNSNHTHEILSNDLHNNSHKIKSEQWKKESLDNGTLGMTGLSKAERHNQVVSKTRQHGQLMPNWLYLSLILALVGLVVAVVVYAVQSSWSPLELSTSPLSHVAATFVNRCKLFGSSNADDSELLMMDQQQNGINNNDLVYDHSSEGLVFLQTNHQDK